MFKVIINSSNFFIISITSIRPYNNYVIYVILFQKYNKKYFNIVLFFVEVVL